MTRDPHDDDAKNATKQPSHSADSLLRALVGKGYQPAEHEIEPLLALVVAGEREQAEAASRALARMGRAATAAALARLSANSATAHARSRLVRLLGRLAHKTRDAQLVELLLARVGDDDEKTARHAALALGKLSALELAPARSAKAPAAKSAKSTAARADNAADPAPETAPTRSAANTDPAADSAPARSAVNTDSAAGGAPGRSAVNTDSAAGSAPATSSPQADDSAAGQSRSFAARAEAVLLARWPSAPASLRRALAEALGKVGSAAALALLDGALASGGDADPELRRVVDEARLKLRRTRERQSPGTILADRAPATATAVRVHCRHGLARMCAEELAALGARVADDATVSLTLEAKLSSLWMSRTMLRFGFPLPTVAPGHSKTGKKSDKADPIDDEALGAAVVSALTSKEAEAIFARFTDGPVRYRLEWADAGHRRALTFRVAAAVAARRPQLVNDPTASLWEAVVVEKPRVSVEIWPRGLADPRFVYRRAYVPASSHPTLAAALARVGGARADEVVWDPFVGAAAELVERSLLGPCAALYGTDADANALARARENLAAANVTAELTQADARTFRPPLPPTLIVTNPPLGRRVLDRHTTGALYREFLTHAVTVLAPRGRIVWISPRGDETVAYATELGLRATLRQRVDMGGFWAEIQAFVCR
jgi:23S rRNA G2445 N2-methylase RlmL